MHQSRFDLLLFGLGTFETFASGAQARDRFVGEITITAITGFIGAAQAIVSISHGRGAEVRW
jgi:hypothetical protein